MPKRANQHEVEDISRSKFQLKLPRNWVYRNKEKDYGIDGEVEIFDKNKEPNGLVFWVQLKATESKIESTIMSVSLKVETLEYYKKLEIPVLLVRYSLKNDSFLIKWISNVDLFYAKKNAKTIKLKFLKKDVWNKSTSEEIEAYLKKLRNVKSGSFAFPFLTSFSIDGSKINSFNSGILLTKLKKEIQGYSDFISYTNKQSNSLIEVSLDNKILKISVIDLCSCSFHSIELREKENFIEGIAKDILLGISVCMSQLNRIELSGKIIFENGLGIWLIKKELELQRIILLPLIGSSFLKETIDLMSKIQNFREYFDLSLYAQISLLLSPKSKNEQKNKIIESFLRNKLNKSIENPEEGQIGIDYYNLGNHFKSQNKFLDAIHYYNLARKFEPIYLNQFYFYAELGGILFSAKKYSIASRMYLKSIEIKEDNWIRGLYADSLMFAGEYKKSLLIFTEYLKKEDNPNEEFLLKKMSLETILEDHKINKQFRNSKKAESLSKFSNDEDKLIQIKKLQEALKFDLLCGLTWYNLGIAYSENSEFIEATFCFTMAALINPNDLQAWKNSTFCIVFSNDYSIFTLVLKTAYFYHKEDYLELIFEHFDIENKPKESAQLISLIEEILNDFESEIERPILRLLNEKGEFEEISKLIERVNKNPSK